MNAHPAAAQDKRPAERTALSGPLLNELETLYGLATKGPWYVQEQPEDSSIGGIRIYSSGARWRLFNDPKYDEHDTEITEANCCCCGRAGIAEIDNANFIVAFVNAWPILRDALVTQYRSMTPENAAPKMKRTLAAALIALTASGCTMVGHLPAPDGWPVLTEKIERPGFWAVQSICGGLPPFTVTAGCAQIHLSSGTCTIYSAVTGEDEVYLLEHERAHCQGRDHIGSTALLDHFNTWRHVLTEPRATR